MDDDIQTVDDSIENAASKILAFDTESDDDSGTDEGKSDERASDPPADEIEELATLDDEPEGGEEDVDAEDDPDVEGPVEPEPDALVTVKVDGKEEQVTYEELKKGYSRQGNYTRSKQALAEERKAFEAERTQSVETRDRYIKALEKIEEALGEPKEPDWDALEKQMSADDLAKAQMRWERQNREREKVKAEKARVEKEQEEERSKSHQQLIAHEYRALTQAEPEFADREKANALMSNIWEAAGKHYGFKAEELSEILDHRAILALRDAMRYQQIVAKRDELRKNKKDVPVVKPGTRRTAKSKTKVQRQKALDRLRQTNSIDDAARAIELME